MQKWIIITDGEIARDEVTIATKERQFDFNSDDSFVTLAPKDSQWIFSVSGRIIETTTEKMNVLQGVWGNNSRIELYRHKIKCKSITRIEPYSLDDLKYSLLSYPRIFTKIFKQVNAAFVINDKDFSTITDGRIFMARTAFGRLLSSLPIESQFDFIKYVIDNSNCFDLRVMGYKNALEFLFKFIDARLNCPGEEIVKANQVLTDVYSNTGIALEEIGIYDEREDKGRSIRKQSKYFNHLRNIDHKLKIRTQILNHISENESKESAFEQIFRKYNWPVTL
jgi:hypothetical protein